MNKKFFSLSAVLLCNILLLAQILFATSFGEVAVETRNLPEKEEWFFVLPGKIQGNLEKTSTGSALITDQRNLVLINCYDKKIELQKKLNYKPIFLSVGISDLMYVIDDRTTLHIYNRNGREICSKKLGFMPAEKPAIGKDGSVFLRNENTILCFTFKGDKIFEKSYPGQLTSVPLKVLNDGSVFFLTKKYDIKHDIYTENDAQNMTKNMTGDSTYGVRISPCGNVMDLSYFNKQIMTMSYLNGSLFIRFSDGTVCSYNSKSSYKTKFDSYPPANNSPTSRTQGKMLTALTATGFSEDKIETLSNGQFIGFTDSSIFVVSESDVLQVFYEYYFNQRSQVSMCASYLLVALEDWTFKAYRIRLPSKYNGSVLSQDKRTINTRTKNAACPEYLQIAQGIKNSTYSSTTKTLGELLEIAKESPSEFYSSLKYMAMMQEYYDRLHREYNQSYELLDRDMLLETTERTFTFMEICSTIGCNSFPVLFCDVILRDKNSLNVAKALECASKIGYDEGMIMQSAEKYIHDSNNASNELISLKLCTFILENYKIMGNSPSSIKAKQILSYMLTTQTNENIKKIGRETVQKLIALQN